MEERIKTQTVERSAPATVVTNDRGVSKAVQVVRFITGLILTLLAVRFAFALLGANLANPIANFIYVITEPLVAPFRGLLQISQFQAGVSRFEIETLLAMAIYALIAWGIIHLILLARR